MKKTYNANESLSNNGKSFGSLEELEKIVELLAMCVSVRQNLDEIYSFNRTNPNASDEAVKDLIAGDIDDCYETLNETIPELNDSIKKYLKAVIQEVLAERGNEE